MSFGRVRASNPCVKSHTCRLAIGTLAILTLAFPLCGEDAASSIKTAIPSSAASGKTEELAAARSTLVSANAAPVLPPVTPAPVHPAPAMIVRFTTPERSRAALRTWQALVVAQHSAAIFDAWTTRKALSSGNGYERDPLMKPFANSATIYPATQAAPLLFDFLGYRMMRSHNRYLRHTWWVPQAVSFAGSMWCGSRNLRVANLKR